jgi:hypothetical protein
MDAGERYDALPGRHGEGRERNALWFSGSGGAMSERDLNGAMQSPSEVYDSPEAIRDDASLSREDKIRLLRSWAYDENELLVAEEEGMGRGEKADVARVLAVLDELTGGFDSEHTPPTKHGGVSDSGDAD